MIKRLQKINGSALCRLLSVPAWITDKNGIVTEVNRESCPIPKGKSIFQKGITTYERSGLLLWAPRRQNPMRYYFRQVDEGMLCVAYRYLQCIPDPFGVREKRITSLMDDLTAVLARLSLHPQAVFVEWLRIWRLPSAFPSVQKVLCRLPETISVRMLSVLFSQCFSLFGTQFCVKSEMPDGLQMRSSDSLSFFLQICAAYLLLAQSGQTVCAAELHLTAERDWIDGHLSITLDACDEDAVRELLETLRLEIRAGKENVQMLYHVTNQNLLIHFHNALPPQQARVKWTWRNIEDSAIRQWMDTLILIADGLCSLDLQAIMAMQDEKATVAVMI